MIDIGLVLQAEGNGERFVPVDIPKPIFPLSWDKETCLGNILENVPGSTPIFLHIQPKQKPRYDEYFKENGIKRDIFYLYQEESPLYGIEGEAIIEDGKVLKMPNGPGSFRDSLEELNKKRSYKIDYFAVYDGCKTGICWDDVVSGVERLVQEDKGVLCYTKELSKEYFDKGKNFRRYDIVIDSWVSDKRHAPADIMTDRKAKALVGMNIFNYGKFMKNTKGLEGSLEEYEYLDCVAHYYDYRIVNLIQGFDESDKIFVDMPEEHYFPSIKLPSDFEKYWDFKDRRNKNEFEKNCKGK